MDSDELKDYKEIQLLKKQIEQAEIDFIKSSEFAKSYIRNLPRSEYNQNKAEQAEIEQRDKDYISMRSEQYNNAVAAYVEKYNRHPDDE